MRKMPLIITGTLTLGLSLPILATAQTAEGPGQQYISLTDWDTGILYQGWRAENLIDTEVQGIGGEEIGEVEDILFGPDGNVVGVIIEGGGFWDIGDTHFRVAWEDLDIGPALSQVTIPMTEETVEDYSVFEGWDDRETARFWRASDLIGDYASLTDVATYGMVDDLIISREGNLEAVIVTADVEYGATGPYAYPYYGYDYGFDPAADVYEL
ncbi:MAG: PRC-barrel domain-containing protein, partial [Candidatus Competibacteraceae bacterium]|nr:PRC-barrel domain-containing protein [Candidatus Competibacteraceae bacterium]